MPKPRSSIDPHTLAALIDRHPEGIGVDGLLRALGEGVARRTLQRRLAGLVAQGRILTRGEARALKYFPAPAGSAVMAMEPSPSAAPAPYVTLSAEGAELRDLVRRPLHLRRPVGYDIGFVERYRANDTFYLPEPLRAQLHVLGRSPVGEAAAGTFAGDILNRLLIDLSWASSRLEGNTYSRLDTERLIELGEIAEGKDALETQMILNHKAAIEYLVHGASRVGVDRETLLSLHALLSDGLLRDPQAGGRVRSRAVEISGCVYRPLALPQQLDELFDIVTDIAADIEDPFEQAFFLMVHLPYLQPFEDVNKRVSRLAANIPLIRTNLCPLSFIDVPQQAYVDAMIAVYELNRIELLRDVFVQAYARSCQQYVAVTQQLVPPDTFRLRHRKALTEAVRAIVLGGLPANAATARTATPAGVAEADQARFAELVLQEFRSLHEGNAVRFGLRPLEFADWLTAHGGSINTSSPES